MDFQENFEADHNAMYYQDPNAYNQAAYQN